jgi:hypothetical protein
MATLPFGGLRKFYHGAAPIDQELFHHEGTKDTKVLDICAF